jgi:NADPH-dependent curcumin reductase CurA
MSQHPAVNQRVVLNSRPHGAPTADNFRLEQGEVPTPAEGQILLRTLYLSLDPYMRARISDAPSYAPPVALGDVMVGGTVSRVIESKNPAFQVGQLVLGESGWQDYVVSDGTDLLSMDGIVHPSHALSVLGMPGFTAWHGLLKIGEPQAGETVVVAAASGPVGAVVGQIAKLRGARVIGIAGGADKCQHVVQDLGFDLCLDRRDPQWAQQLVAACPEGIDVYYENVGGEVFDAVLPLLNVGARIPLCGIVSHYNDTELAAGPDRTVALLSKLLFQRIRLQGFIIGDYYATEHATFLAEMAAWVAEGKVKLREDVVDGLANAPAAFIGLLQGHNFGKVVVKLAD